MSGIVRPSDLQPGDLTQSVTRRGRTDYHAGIAASASVPQSAPSPKAAAITLLKAVLGSDSRDYRAGRIPEITKALNQLGPDDLNDALSKLTPDELQKLERSLASRYMSEDVEAAFENSLARCTDAGQFNRLFAVFWRSDFVPAAGRHATFASAVANSATTDMKLNYLQRLASKDHSIQVAQEIQPIVANLPKDSATITRMAQIMSDRELAKVILDSIWFNEIAPSRAQVPDRHAWLSELLRASPDPGIKSRLFLAGVRAIADAKVSNLGTTRLELDKIATDLLRGDTTGIIGELRNKYLYPPGLLKAYAGEMLSTGSSLCRN
jgi:hypothetical protein